MEPNEQNKQNEASGAMMPEDERDGERGEGANVRCLGDSQVACLWSVAGFTDFDTLELLAAHLAEKHGVRLEVRS